LTAALLASVTALLASVTALLASVTTLLASVTTLRAPLSATVAAALALALTALTVASVAVAATLRLAAPVGALAAFRLAAGFSGGRIPFALRFGGALSLSLLALVGFGRRLVFGGRRGGGGYATVCLGRLAIIFHSSSNPSPVCAETSSTGA
jgi:hypothetical protein